MYKKSSLQLIKYGLNKHLKATSQIDINSSEFNSSNIAYLKAVVVDLTKKGLGDMSNTNHRLPLKT